MQEQLNFLVIHREPLADLMGRIVSSGLARTLPHEAAVLCPFPTQKSRLHKPTSSPSFLERPLKLIPHMGKWRHTRAEETRLMWSLQEIKM